ncbi:MAG TPA: class I SAM-dependent methyltransferase [Verrucomicrobiae bacterium]|nr:class I SAM-dependent methyltransferase [Verrucomicrobiae bacterium]
MENYIHGYDPEEQGRLYRQARFLEPVVYETIDLTGIRSLLEVGCGVGAQTEILLGRTPGLRITGVDLAAAQVARAREHFEKLPVLRERCEFRQMDATKLEFGADTKFDGAFICWLLEHAPDPLAILAEIRRVLRPGGRVMLTEVLNHTLFLSPPSPALKLYWDRYNALQERMGGDPFVGARLGTLLDRAGFQQIQILPRVFYYDRRVPEKRAAMLDYWIELLLSGADQLETAGEIASSQIEDLQREMAAAKKDPNAVFFYTFVQAFAVA